MVATLPTLRTEHLVTAWLTQAARYHHLDAAVRAGRGGPAPGPCQR